MNRSLFLASSSSASLAAVTLSRAADAALDVPGGRDLVERKASFDLASFEKAVGKKADIAQLYETLAIKPVVFNNIKNSLNGLEFGFGYSPERVSVVVANHGPSSAYTYSDGIWAKYRIGDFFDVKDKDGMRIAKNVYYPRRNPDVISNDPNDQQGSLQDVGIAALQSRGVIFLTCHTAVEEQARGLVTAGHAPVGMTGSDVAADILSNLIPGAVVVPSMVATIAVLQARFRYTYVTIQS